ncbi:MAG: hypothetical protein ACXAC7_07950 [Candidatus Hodarchaeales archaeon]|jgi:hypothetical protein
MAILVRLLNKTVNITRPTGATNTMGEPTGAVSTVETGIVCRINKHKFIGQDTFNQAGRVSTASYKAFFNVGVDIQAGDYIIDGSDKYWVDNVDTAPGGKEDSHYEVECTKSNT